MRRIIFVLSLAGIAGFSILILPPVFSMIVNYALSLQSMWWHTDEAGFVKAMVLEAGIGGILFSLLTLLSSLGALEKLLSLFIKKARLYGKVLFWPVLLAPIVYLYVIIAVFGVNYPQGEDWNYLRDFIPALLDGSMSAWDFILAQCDSIHFHIIPYALACALLVITGCNIKMLLFVANTFWIIPYFCFARYIRLKYQAGGDFQKTASVLLASAIGFMLVNISQRQIFLHLEWAFGYGIACAFMFCAFVFFESGFNAKLRGGGGTIYRLRYSRLCREHIVCLRSNGNSGDSLCFDSARAF